MISSFQVWTSVGNLVGTVVDNFTAQIEGRNSYIIPLGIIYVVPVIMSIGLLFVPESPRWLMEHGKSDQARSALVWLRPYTDAEIDDEVRGIRDALVTDAERHKGVAIMDMFNNPIDRRRTILAVCALTVQGGSGAMYMIGKSARVLTPQLRVSADIKRARSCANIDDGR
jgi:SP family sugar:H+ symporter-like MFS transporter